MRTTVELTGENRWAWGRNGEIRRPKFVTVNRMDWADVDAAAPVEVWLSVYATQRSMENSASPIDLHMSPEDARELGRALLEAAAGA